jgi:heterodisulfide reductase subunit C
VESTSENRPDNIHEPTSSFAKEVAEVPGGEVIGKCVQCGLCTACCVVASVSEKYRPRQLIQWIIVGMRDEVLSSELPWLCAICRMCTERCQEGVSPADIFRAVRHIAAEEGHIPLAFKSAVSTVLKDGWMLDDAYSDFVEDDRDDLGLDVDLGWNKEFLKKIKERFFEGVID